MKLRRNPSSAHTWTVCTAQPHYIRQFADKLPPNDTEYNREGTVAHSVVEHLFKENAVDYSIDGFKKEMGTHAQAFRRYCFDLLGSSELWWSERKVSLFYAPESSGYIDFSGIRANGGVLIADFKYGQGVAVTAEENLQLAIYAESLIREQCPGLDRYAEVTMAIFQPRVREGEKQTTWTLSYGELLQFLEEHVVIAAEDIAQGRSLKFSPSTDVCRFCPAAGFCGMQGYEPNFEFSGSQRAANLLDDTPLAPIRKGLPARLKRASELPVDVLTNLVLRKKEIEKFLKDAGKYAAFLLHDGKSVPGLKLVKGRGGHRAWRNEDDVRTLLLEHLRAEDVIVEKLITPAQADQFEHDLPKEKWEVLKAMAYKPEGGPTLVSESDPRPAYGQRDISDLLEDETVRTQEDWV